MIDLLRFKEYTETLPEPYKSEFGECPSMKDCFQAEAYPGEEKIINYLLRGKVGAIAAGYDRDMFTGETIPGTLCTMSDGKYAWSSSLAYYVKKYHLRLMKEFEDEVLSA